MPALIFILYFLLCLSFVLYSYVAINFCFFKHHSFKNICISQSLQLNCKRYLLWLFSRYRLPL